MKNLLVSTILAAALVAPATYAMSEVEREARRMNMPPHHNYMHNSHMHQKKMMHEKGMKHHHKHHPKHMKHKGMHHKHMKKGHMHTQKSPHKMQKGEGTEGKMEQRTKAQINRETELNNH